MSKFGKKSQTSQDIPTAALPDIIFMLLFFFMVTTVMREVELLVDIQKPEATEIQKLEKKDLIDYVYIGKPLDADRDGDRARLQLDDQFADLKDVAPWKVAALDARPDEKRNKVTTSFKVDKEAEMGMVTDIKQILRKNQWLKINYSSAQAAQ